MIPEVCVNRCWMVIGLVGGNKFAGSELFRRPSLSDHEIPECNPRVDRAILVCLLQEELTPPHLQPSWSSNKPERSCLAASEDRVRNCEIRLANESATTSIAHQEEADPCVLSVIDKLLDAPMQAFQPLRYES